MVLGILKKNLFKKMSTREKLSGKRRLIADLYLALRIEPFSMNSNEHAHTAALSNKYMKYSTKRYFIALSN